VQLLFFIRIFFAKSCLSHQKIMSNIRVEVFIMILEDSNYSYRNILKSNILTLIF